MIWLLPYAIICIALAWYNAYLIEHYVDWDAGKRIKHFYNGLFHAAAIAAAWIWLGWKVAICVPLVGRIVFDLASNYFHIPRQPFGFVSSSPKKSIVDKVEQFFFGRDGITPKIIYAVALIVINIFL